MSLGPSIIRIKTLISREFDPVIGLLLNDIKDEEVHEENQDGRLVSALAIHLATRDRVKMSGKMIAGALGHHGRTSEADDNDSGAAEAQLVFAIQQSLGMK